MPKGNINKVCWSPKTFFSAFVSLLISVENFKTNSFTITLPHSHQVYIAAALVFYLENMGEASEQFTTMFHSLWWSVVTMGTVGYGDLSPTQVPGKVRQ